MKPELRIQLDEELAKELDRIAVERKLSTTDVVLESIRAMIRGARLRRMVDQELEAYRRMPETEEEREEIRELMAAQDRVLAKLNEEDPW